MFYLNLKEIKFMMSTIQENLKRKNVGKIIKEFSKNTYDQEIRINVKK